MLLILLPEVKLPVQGDQAEESSLSHLYLESFLIVPIIFSIRVFDVGSPGFVAVELDVIAIDDLGSHDVLLIFSKDGYGRKLVIT
jgi:hypothetical protein